jgi:hypothetical protein
MKTLQRRVFRIMKNVNDTSGSRIVISRKTKVNGKFQEIRVDKKGRLYIDGELFDENNMKHKNVSINIERYRKVNTGDDTQKMLEEMKKSNKGDTVIIRDVNTPTRTEKTTVKF